MAYATLTDLKKTLSEAQLIQLTDDAGLGLVDQPTIDKAIADADAEIDSYLGGRYTVPLSPVPALVNRLSADLAIYHLYSRRMSVPEQREKRYEASVDLLKMLSKGTATLGEATPQRASDQIGGAKTNSDPADRKFTTGKGGSTGTLDNF